MAAPKEATKPKEVPVVSTKAAKRAIIQPKKKAFRNLLAKPYANYWPETTDEENEKLNQAFQCLIKEETKEFGVFDPNDKVSMKLKKKKWSDTLVFGINDVPRHVRKHAVEAVLLASDVDPKFLIQHITDLCGAYAVPILLIPFLRTFTKTLLGFSSIAVGIKKEATETESICLQQLFKTVKTIAQNHQPPPELKLFTKVVSSPTPAPKKPETVPHAMPPVCPSTDLYLYRTSVDSRVFVPKSQKIQSSVPSRKVIVKQKKKLEDFISLGADTDSDEMIETQSTSRGISYTVINDAQKKEETSFPPFVPFKYVKVRANPDKASKK